MIFLATGGIVGYAQWKEKKRQASFIKQVDRKLTAEDQKIYEDKLAAAETGFNDAKNDDEKFDWTMEKATVLSGLGRLAQARLVFESAIAIKPQNYVGYFALFQVLQEMNDNQSALSSIKKVMEIKPENPANWRSYITFEKERLHASNPELNSLYIEALAKTHSNIDIITVYAQFLESIGNLQESKEYWQKAIIAFPPNTSLYQVEIDRLNKKSGK